MYKKILRMIPIYLLLIIIALMVVLPIIWVVLSGFKYEQDIISWPPSFFPRKLTNENWETIKSRIDIVKYIVNSVVYSVGTTVPAIFVNTLAGYAFSKLEFKGKNIIFVHMESMQSFLMNLSFNGREVTPNCRYYFYCFFSNDDDTVSSDYGSLVCRSPLYETFEYLCRIDYSQNCIGAMDFFSTGIV